MSKRKLISLFVLLVKIHFAYNQRAYENKLKTYIGDIICQFYKFS